MRRLLGMTDHQHDVVVVGAGYAGLSAALRLRDAGVDVVVLEASGRVGGRVLSEHRPDGLVLDHGGQWVGPTQKHLLALASRFGCGTFPSYESGDHVEVWRDGTTTTYRDLAPTAAPGQGAYDAVVAELEELSRGVHPHAPGLTDDAAHLDGQSALDFFRSRTDDPDVLARLTLFVHGIWCAEPAEISLLHVLFYVATAGGYHQLMETGGGAQDSRFTDGAAATARAVAQDLGDRLVLGAPVRRIVSSTTGVRVETDGLSVAARRVVVAVPPTAVPGIAFDPPLPTVRSQWLASAAMGRVAKVHAIYDRPWWREQGLSGIATLYHEGPVGVVFDNSPADGSRGVLVAFVYADRAAAWGRLDDGARRQAVLDDLARVVGPSAYDATDVTEQRWTEDPWARGGYEAFQRPGGWTSASELGWRAPSGLVHWAGTETAEEWNGYIDGAISSGERAAAEVALALHPVLHPAQ